MIRAAPLLAAVLLAATGCAAARAERARTERLTAALDATAVARPMDEVWQEVRRVLADAGLTLPEADAEAIGQDVSPLFRLLSPGEATSQGADGARTLLTARSQGGVRYRATGRQVPGGVRVELTRLESDLNDQGRPPRERRDVALELRLLRRLDAAAADGLEARLEPAASPAEPAPAPRAP